MMSEIEKYQFIHHFVPHHEHKKRATLLSISALFAYSLLILLFFGVIKITPKAYPGVLGYASDINISDLLNETNKVREDHKLPTLKSNSILSIAAQKKAEDMFKNDYWAHVSPKGVKPWDFIISSNYDYAYAGENLAKNFGSSSEVVNAWFRSPSHRENLLSTNYEDIGFAVVNGVLDGYETTLVVQMFGSPRQPGFVATTEGSGTVRIDTSTSTVATEEEALRAVVPPAPVQISPVSPTSEKIVATIDLTKVSKYILGIFTVFLLSLMSLDIWYSKKRGIPKVTGHTFAHITFLIFVLASVWLALTPGRVL